ncbi:MAG: hypothetical protein OXC95_16905 [Dehalococcoidia bacterium]|nr:hypothetical protein [Dehalococcoidia bacterium]
MILLDEAVSGIDVGAQEGIIEILQACVAADRIALVSTHDLSKELTYMQESACRELPEISELRPPAAL